MKKKILGIILTLTMVLTMLPALALPTKADGSQSQRGLEVFDAEGNPAKGNVDYEWIENQLIIKTGGLIVSGETKEEYIFIDSNVKDITLKGVKIIPEKYEIVGTAIKSNSEDLIINLLGENQLGNTVEYNKDETTSKNYFLDYGIVSNANITFVGPETASLKIYDCGSGVKSEKGKTNKIIFGEDFAGTVKIEHWGNHGAICSDEDIEISGGKVIVNTYGGEGIYSINNTTINDAIVNVYSSNSCAMYIGEDLYVGGNAKVTALSDSKGNPTIRAKNVSIEGKADFSAISNLGMGALGVEDGKVEILSSGSIKLSSKEFVALTAGKIVIGDKVKDAVFYGSYSEDDTTLYGAVATSKKPDISEKLLIYGGVDVTPDFDPEDIIKKGNKARIDKVELPDEDGGKSKKGENGKDDVEIYTCFVGNEVANALVIRNIEEPTTPENPKTEDTNPMLIWAFAGLFALAIAAGILVSKKQKN